VLRDNVLADVSRLNGLYTQNLQNAGVTLYHERAVLLDAHTLQVGDDRVTADRILIATGARPQLPEVEGVEHGITSNEAFHLDEIPRRVVIAGGGYIANEFAGIFNEFGSDVTIMLRGDTILRGYDHSLRERLHLISTVKGIKFRFNAGFERIEKANDGTIRIHVTGGDVLETDLLMYAIGRVPNSEGLGLDKVGIETDKVGAIPVDADSRTAVENIYAVGDVTNRVQLTPVAIREGHAFADTVFGGKPWRVDYDCIPSAVFSHPPIAAVGMTEAEARNRHGQVKVYSSDFRAMKNVLADRNERALYKLVVDPVTERLLGAHMIGPDAPEIMQSLAICVKAGLTKPQLDATVAIHPTMAEELVLMK
jgi:glutathione reductase (NADPH)